MNAVRPVKPVTIAKAVPAERKFYWPKTPVEQTYSLVVGISAAVIFLARFLTDGPAPAVTFALPAAFGFLFRMPKMPAIAVIMLGYFLFAPGLFPFGTGETLLIRFGHFDLMNIILVSATLVYLFAQYRLLRNDSPGHAGRSTGQPARRKSIRTCGRSMRSPPAKSCGSFCV